MDPQIYNITDHTLQKSACDPHALSLIQDLQEAGHIAYLVGGSVRDLLLGTKPKDFDISTSARPEEIKSLFGRRCLLIGRRFRLAHLRFGQKVFEVSTFRAGDTDSAELIVRDNLWGTPEQDVLRRDFTINGLFYDPTTETVIDFVDGYSDLKKQTLRTIGSPFLRFKQDPVRMIRLIKFQARLHFDVDEEATTALAECAREIVKSSQARIFEEILRMLESGSAEPFFDLMDEHRFLELLMPPLAHFLTIPEGEEVFDLLFEIDSLRSPLDRALLLSCLVFPFLKKRLHTHFVERNKTPTIDNLHHEIHNAISSLFHPFFLLPRKLRTSIFFILLYQYRMTPLRGEPTRKIRIPKSPEFHLALELLHLRTNLDPALKTTWEMWHDAYRKM